MTSYYSRHRDKMLSRQMQYQCDHHEEYLAYQREYYVRHRTMILKKRKDARTKPERNRDNFRRYYYRHREEICERKRLKRELECAGRSPKEKQSVARKANIRKPLPPPPDENMMKARIHLY